MGLPLGGSPIFVDHVPHILHDFRGVFRPQF